MKNSCNHQPTRLQDTTAGHFSHPKVFPVETKRRVVVLILILIISVTGLACLWEFVIEDRLLGGVFELHPVEPVGARWEYVTSTFIFAILSSATPGMLLFRTVKENTALNGMLSICANCKKIRDEQDSWVAIEVYIRDRFKTEFSHGLCPECIEKLYSDLG